MIKAVIFDYGGVISAGGKPDDLIERFAEVMHIGLTQAANLIYGPWPEFVSGSISEDRYWQKIEKLCGQSIPKEKRLIWNVWKNLKPIDAMIDYVKELKSKGFTVGLMSNIVAPSAKTVIAHHGYDIFKPCLLSYEVGLAKPDIAIYELLLTMLPGVKPAEVVFIDDQQRCLDPAAKLGIKTVLARSSENIIADVNRLLGK